MTGRHLGMRSAFLFGCILLAVPGLVAMALNAFQAWTNWQAAWTAAQGTAAVGDVMRAKAALVAERGWQLGEIIAGGSPSEGLAQAFGESDRFLASAQGTVERAGLSSQPVQRARSNLTLVRNQVALAGEAPAGLLVVVAQQYNQVIEQLEESVSLAERDISLTSPAVAMVLGLARTANEVHGPANYRGMLLSSWFGGHSLTGAQKEELIALDALTTQMLGVLQRGVRISGLPLPLIGLLTDLNTGFLTKQNPTYHEYVRAAVGDGDRVIGHPQYRAWHRTAIGTLRPLREALLAEATVRAEQFMRGSRRDMILAAGMALASLGLVLVALLALLRHLIEPARAMTASMTALVAGDLTGTTSVASRLSEIGAMATAVAVFRDNLASLQQRKADLRRTNLHFTAALDSMSQGIVMCDADERVVVYNQRYPAIVGLPPDRLLLGMAYQDVVSIVVEGVKGVSAEQICADRRARVARNDQSIHVHRTTDGQAVASRVVALPDGGWVATYEDVTDRLKADAQIAYMASHDTLTGLSNRTLFQEQLVEALPRVRRGDQVAVLCLGLDGFKTINDTLGHPVGDELLKAVAQRLKANTRDTDVVARLGGDEFAIIQTLNQDHLDARTLADRLVEALRTPFELDSQKVEIGTSIGVVLADPSSTADELLRNADIALYRAKTEGRGTWRFFENGMNEELRRRRAFETDLRAALELGQLEVHYQPLVKADSQALSGFEALMRWRHPVRGLVPPSEFIPVAEETGLIRAFGRWILMKACADAAGWPIHIKVAVNLSPLQFQDDQVIQDVRQALVGSGLAAERLELEITESLLLQDSESTSDMLHRLHGLGLRISMDDFGTGYSSLSYLRRFPFDKIKIDQSFVRNLSREKGSLAIIRAVVSLGKALDMEVLAEGVETLDQLDILRAEGCDELQGYLFSKPRPLQDLAALIANKFLATPPEGRPNDRRVVLTPSPPALQVGQTENQKVDALSGS